VVARPAWAESLLTSFARGPGVEVGSEVRVETSSPNNGVAVGAGVLFPGATVDPSIGVGKGFVRCICEGLLVGSTVGDLPPPLQPDKINSNTIPIRVEVEINPRIVFNFLNISLLMLQLEALGLLSFRLERELPSYGSSRSG